MFIYLSKKIAIPNQVNLRCIAWNTEDGHIAVGGDDGLLKVLKLETPKEGLVATSSLFMNQTLEGHNGSVQLMAWNEKHQRLATADSSGLIIVWMLHKGTWFEEMVNNRNKSVVRGMAWSSDGQRICIIYDDGAIIVGSVDGNRLWGKELKGVSLQLAEWSADGKYLLFGLRSGEIHIYDQGGNFVSKMSIIQPTPNSNIVAIKWHKRGPSGERPSGGALEVDVPALAIASDEGHIQLLKKEVDLSPILIDCDMIITGSEWSPSGNMIAVIGRLLQTREPDKKNIIKLFSNQGQYLHTLVVPGTQITGCTWEGSGLRLAVSVDSFIYFVNVRPDYMWCYFSDCVLFTHSKPDRAEQCFTLWDIKNRQKHINFRRGVLAIASSKGHAAVATRHQAGVPDQFNIEVWDNIGALVDQVIIENEPIRMAVCGDVVAIASHCDLYVWRFRDVKQRAEGEPNKSQQTQQSQISKISGAEGDSKFALTNGQEEICCLAAEGEALVVALESGLVKRYTLPNVSLSHKYNLQVRPKMIALNCNNTMMSVIDMSGNLSLYGIESDSSKANQVDFHRKDVWDVRWAWDEPELFAYMEKTRLVIVHRLETEDATTCAGYLCAIEELRVKCVLLDEILAAPEQALSVRSHVVVEDTCLLKQFNELLEQATIADVVQFIEDNDSNSILWRKMAKFHMISGDLDAAEMALVRIRDWDGVLFCRRIAKLASREVREAEVLAYFDQFDEAEQMFIDNDRIDLAIEMHAIIGNWERVIELALTSNESNVALIENAYNNLGQMCIDNGEWEKAIHCFKKSHNKDGLATAHYMTEDFDELWKVTEGASDKKLLFRIGEMFESVGMCDEAVHCFVNSDAHTRAMEVCIELNEWKTAIELARDHGQVADVSGLLAKYARQFIEKDNILSAVELYRRAGRFREAARLLNELARSDRVGGSVLKKQIYVLAAMLADQGKTGRNRPGFEGATQSLTVVGEDNLWRYAQAYHFLALAQRQFYREKYEQALTTALHLKEYDDILDCNIVYQLIALTSVMSRAWGHCSRALTYLETSEGFSASEREQLEQVSLCLFSKNVPKKNKVENAVCLGCGITLPDGSTLCPTCGVRYPLCVASGAVITDTERAWRCGQCRHSAIRGEVLSFTNCPLCHFPKQNGSTCTEGES
ncbi:WD repeat-containing protein 35-like [Varroa jacobsoni]|uniref:WD repeat-containing protein 35-like n=1 Tax=Varroa jacobsoni TaxID=62625 RepID=UPI000BFA044A|nr:WD repeat-containing protein 35-like [Varroa jacobsoni]